MAALVPYLMAMLLGRTLDLRTYRVGGVVYSDDKYTEVTVNQLTAKYQVGGVIGFPPDLMLHVKAGYSNTGSGAMGLDGLLKDLPKFSNSVLLPIFVFHHTVNRTIPEDEEPLPRWQDRVMSTSTHYTRTLCYGNWFVALFRLVCDIPQDVDVVETALKSVVGAAGDIDSTFPDLWRRGHQAVDNTTLRGRVELAVSVYSSTPISSPLTTPEDVMAAINELTSLMKEDGDNGEPFLMDLVPLRDLDPSFPDLSKNTDRDFLKDMIRLDKMLDDALDTYPKLFNWVRAMRHPLTKEETKKIAGALADLGEVQRFIREAVYKISFYNPDSPKLVEDAIRTYLAGLPDKVATYRQMFLKMKEDIGAVCRNEYTWKGRGLLHVTEDEQEGGGRGQEVDGGLEGCQQWCNRVARCRAIGYGEDLAVQDPESGEFLKSPNRCWLFYRSTATAPLKTPTEVLGKLIVHDRKCG